MPTLSLSMIVGPGEAFELERCLKSVQGPLFDEIVVTLTSQDTAVKAVAEKYATKTPYFPWVDDFSAARQFCLSHCTGDFFCWIDADDVIKSDDYQKLLKLKPNLDNHEVIWIKYVYSHDEHGNPDTVLPRERIFPNNGKFSWGGAIHECVYPEGNVSHFEDRIEIHHYQRLGVKNMERNLRILEKEYAKPDCSERMRFYYARDLLGSGDWAKGEKVALECVDNNLLFGENKASLCRSLAATYYGKSTDDKLSVEQRERLRDLCVRYCLIGINEYCRFAELWAYLGCVAYDRKDEEKAILYFETALGCLKEAYSGSRSPYYAEIPSRNLYMIYYHRGDYAKALMYNKIIIERDPNDTQAKENRDLTWRQYWNKFQVQPIPNAAGALPQPDHNRPKAVPQSPISVAWLIPYLNMDDPATRIRRVNISQKMERMGYDSSVIYDYHGHPIPETLKQIRDAFACIFTQYGPYDIELMKAVKAAGKRVIVDACEAIFGVPGQAEAYGMADWVTCCSTKLAEMHREKGFQNVSVIADAIEVGL